MFKNYLKITLRNLKREKLYALINIFGLSLGIGCALILGLYISNELSYDSHHENHENLYRIVNEYTFSGNGDALALSSQALAPLLIKDNPEAIKSYTRFRAAQLGQRTVFRNEDTSFFWDRVYLADLNALDVFKHTIVYGNPENALDEGSSIAVSRTFSEAYFGNSNPVGEVLSTDSAQYQITAVFEDLPETSHLQYDVLISMNRIAALPDDDATLQRMLGNVGYYTYVTLNDGFDEGDFVPMLERFSDQRITEMAAAFGLDDFSARFWAQNITDIHLDSEVDMDEPTGNRFYILGFAAVALFILVIACINYINLATSRSIKRSREVGMRKVLGADRGQLVWQFIGESIVFVLISLVISLAAVSAVLQLGLLDNLLGQELLLSTLFTPLTLLGLIGLSVLIGILSGLYPAFYLSAVAPMVALASGSKNGRSGGGKLRQVLVLLQFIISIGIISSTLVMTSQMRYISNLSLGFSDENKMLVTLRRADLIEQADALKNELLSNPSILAAAETRHVPGGLMGLSGLNLQNNEGVFELISTAMMMVGDDFFDTMDIEVLSGRGFSKEVQTDNNRSFVVNQTMVDSMGWDQPIGKQFSNGEGEVMGAVVGVVKDFHFDSLHQPIAPLTMAAAINNFSEANAEGRALATETLVLSVAGDELARTIEFVTEVMRQFDPVNPIEYEFLDDQLDALYTSEQNVMSLTAIFSAICVFISCLGLFGLASFTTEQRTKEIGIRKVLGASGFQIVSLLSRNILGLVLIASVIAALASYFFVNQWLQGFAYRVSIDPIIFLTAALMALLVAASTVALQSLKTVRSNPILALRYE